MESPAEFASTLAELWESEQQAVLLFFLSKENMAVMKSAFQNQDEEMRRLAIVGYGKLYLRVWAVVHQPGACGLEGILKFGSISEARRAYDDFIDFGVDMICKFSTALNGSPIVSSDITQPPIPLTYNCFCGYCEVLCDLLSVSNSNSSLRRWCDALQGKFVVSASSSVIDISPWQSLISVCVSTLMKDFSEISSWSNRWRSCEAYFRMISNCLVTILKDIPLHHSLATTVFDPLHSSSASMFGLDSNSDETLASRRGSLPVNIVRFAEEWILHSLVYFWENEAVCSREECLASIWDAMELVQYSFLSHIRLQISAGIFNALIKIIRSFEEYSSEIINSSLVRSALCLALFSTRSLPAVLLANAINTLLWCCGNGCIVDNIFLTRFTAELSALVLTRALAGSSQANVQRLIASVLDDSWLSNVLSEAASASASASAANSAAAASLRRAVFKDRFVLSLCRAAERLLPLVITKCLAASSAASSGSESGREFGFPLSLTVGEVIDVGAAGDRDRFAILKGYLTSVNMILSKCHRCIEWSVRGLLSEGASHEYISLVQAMSMTLRKSGVLQRLQANSPVAAAALNVTEQLNEFNHFIDTISTAAVFADNVPSSSSILSSSSHSNISLSLPSASTKTTAQSGNSNSNSNNNSNNSISINSSRLLLARVLIQHYISSSDTVLQSKGLDLLQDALLRGDLRVSDMHQLLQLLELAANSNYIGASNIELRRKCLTMLWSFERFITGDDSDQDNAVGTSAGAPTDSSSGMAKGSKGKGHHLSASTCNLPQLRNAIQATRLRMEMSPSEPSALPSREKSDCSRFDTDYENFMNKDITVELQNTLLSTISSSRVTASQSSRDSNRFSTNSSSNASSMRRFSNRLVSDGTGGASEYTGTLLRHSYNGLVDAGLEFGAFSLTALEMARNNQSVSSSSELDHFARISCAELICLVDDVQSAFFLPLSAGANTARDVVATACKTSTTATTTATVATINAIDAVGANGSAKKSTDDNDAAELAHLRRCRSVDGGHSWQRLSGSSEPIVLTARYFCDDSNLIHVIARIYNSSGFKIPYFSLQMLLKSRSDGFAEERSESGYYDGACGSASSGGRSTVEAEARLEAVMLSDKQLLIAGDEFFPPNAMIEKEFVFQMCRFSEVGVVFRIIYSDLQSEDVSAIYCVPHSSGAATGGSSSADSAAGSTKQSHKSNSSARSFTNSINCECLTINLSALLLPYGGGAFSSMRSLACGPNQPNSYKIPLSVFQAQCGRMSHIGSGLVCLDELLLSAVGVESIYNAIAQSVSHRSDRRKLGRCLSLAQVEFAQNKGQNSAQLFAWCLQTIFGEEFCLRISIFPLLGGGQTSWSQRGVVEVQCTNEQTLTTVFMSMHALVHELTGGVLRFVSAEEEEDQAIAAKAITSNTSTATVAFGGPASMSAATTNAAALAYSSGPKERYNRFANSIVSVLQLK